MSSSIASLNKESLFFEDIVKGEDLEDIERFFANFSGLLQPYYNPNSGGELEEH